jgi:hypothetical protein
MQLYLSSHLLGLSMDSWLVLMGMGEILRGLDRNIESDLITFRLHWVELLDVLNWTPTLGYRLNKPISFTYSWDRIIPFVSSFSIVLGL